MVVAKRRRRAKHFPSMGWFQGVGILLAVISMQTALPGMKNSSAAPKKTVMAENRSGAPSCPLMFYARVKFISIHKLISQQLPLNLKCPEIPVKKVVIRGTAFWRSRGGWFCVESSKPAVI